MYEKSRFSSCGTRKGSPAPHRLPQRLVRGAVGVGAGMMLLSGCTPSTAPDLAGPAEGCNREFGDPAASAYVLPFPEGGTYNLIQGYCPPDPTWGHHGWYAYDFDLRTGDTVVASRAGRVRFVREDQPDIGGRCGVNGENLILLGHADGSVMQYVHLTTDGALVGLGDSVEVAQPIGISGNSGCSSGPHLHVVLFADASDFGKEASVPLNYRNAQGPLDEVGGLVQGRDYTASPVR